MTRSSKITASGTVGHGPGESWLNQVLAGDAAGLIRSLPAAMVDTVVTSPPYYRQRDYGHPDQLGQEDSPARYIARLLELFAGIARVLKPSGSAWVVIGDKYEDGQLLGMPWRFALAMQDAGWLLRSDCIWHKPNAMPSPVANRPTTDHEYIFLFARAPGYWYDADAIREPHVTFTERSRMKGGRSHFGRRGGTPESGKNAGNGNLHDGRWDQAFHPLGRNRRTVWSVPLSKSRDAHFAVFPEAIVETCIRATCPAGGVVLDPFFGTGTVGVVAERLGRNWLGMDCVEEFCRLSRRRLAEARLAREGAKSKGKTRGAETRANRAR